MGLTGSIVHEVDDALVGGTDTHEEDLCGVIASVSASDAQ